ncbi:MAG: hypothetical protein LBU56_04425 [Rickettsiales bacterium]|nr:hypothetical protein [Rickettsiales bacterium]
MSEHWDDIIGVGMAKKATWRHHYKVTLVPVSSTGMTGEGALGWQKRLLGDIIIK